MASSRSSDRLAQGNKAWRLTRTISLPVKPELEDNAQVLRDLMTRALKLKICTFAMRNEGVVRRTHPHASISAAAGLIALDVTGKQAFGRDAARRSNERTVRTGLGSVKGRGRAALVRPATRFDCCPSCPRQAGTSNRHKGRTEQLDDSLGFECSQRQNIRKLDDQAGSVASIPSACTDHVLSLTAPSLIGAGTLLSTNGQSQQHQQHHQQVEEAALDWPY
ncbi:hypothetical protein OPT61_g9754 [Boeremia exigua]|uniref:Uncharacterized protein n=1 Tax=Boeremia exigua TaxID=749465 RepID=A0ACC2HSQ9_9PLEO|nr:hypothetical protein OPT61_g9754 [Boeremia exigua]